MSIVSRFNRGIDRQWIRDGYSGSPTLLHRAIFMLPIFAMLFIAEVFGLDGQSETVLYLFVIAMGVCFGLLTWIGWRWFAGYSRTKRWERISKHQRSGEVEGIEQRHD